MAAAWEIFCLRVNQNFVGMDLIHLGGLSMTSKSVMYEFNRRLPGLSEYMSFNWYGNKFLSTQRNSGYSYCFKSFGELSRGFAESDKVFIGFLEKR